MKITKTHDRLFKKLLETFFIEFIELFFPQVSHLIDKTCLRFNQQEIFTDIKDMEEHKIDILVETKLAGEEGLILIHVESQAQRDPEYGRKMFKYFARLYEKYQQKILPIVIYSHDAKLEEPTDHKMAFSFLKVLEFNFFTVQLNKKPWREYIDSSNPVAAALLSKMNYSPKEKIAVKIAFTRMLVNMQLDEARSILLTAFCEQYNKLTGAEEKRYDDRLKQELNQQEVEKLLEITTSYHRKGRVEELTTTVLLLLAKKFKIDILPNKVNQKIKSASIEQLSKIRDDIFEIESLDDLMKYL